MHSALIGPDYIHKVVHLGGSIADTARLAEREVIATVKAVAQLAHVQDPAEL